MTTESVKAILEGRKSQTRRVVTPQTSEVGEGRVDWAKFCWDGSKIYRDTCKHGHTEEHEAPLPFVDGRANENYPYEHQYLHVPYNWEEDMTIFRIYPRYEVGDRLWVRETWQYYSKYQDKPIIYRADCGDIEPALQFREKWRPSIFMPRWASRITLEITGIRVERLQEITVEDAFAEGIMRNVDFYILSDNAPTRIELGDERITYSPIKAFAHLWDSLNAKRGYPWESNPWVWAISFKKLDN